MSWGHQSFSRTQDTGSSQWSSVHITIIIIFIIIIFNQKGLYKSHDNHHHFHNYHLHTPARDAAGLWGAAQHPEHLVPEGGHHPAVDQEVGGGVHREEDVRHEPQRDAPHWEPAQVSVATSAKENCIDNSFVNMMKSWSYMKNKYFWIHSKY